MPLPAVPPPARPLSRADEEPVTISMVVTAVLWLLTLLGVVKFDAVVLEAIGVVVTIVLTFAAQLWARRQVTPLVNPRDNTGTELVRADNGQSPQV